MTDTTVHVDPEPEFLPCDDPSVAGQPLPEPHHDYGKWGRWKIIPGRKDHDDVHQYRERACVRCDQTQRETRVRES